MEIDGPEAQMMSSGHLFCILFPSVLLSFQADSCLTTKWLPAASKWLLGLQNPQERDHPFLSSSNWSAENESHCQNSWTKQCGHGDRGGRIFQPLVNLDCRTSGPQTKIKVWLPKKRHVISRDAKKKRVLKFKWQTNHQKKLHINTWLKCDLVKTKSYVLRGLGTLRRCSKFS